MAKGGAAPLLKNVAKEAVGTIGSLSKTVSDKVSDQVLLNDPSVRRPSQSPQPQQPAGPKPVLQLAPVHQIEQEAKLKRRATDFDIIALLFSPIFWFRLSLVVGTGWFCFYIIGDKSGVGDQKTPVLEEAIYQFKETHHK